MKFNFVKVGGFVILIIAIVLFFRNWEKFQLLKNGEQIEVSVFEIPVNCDLGPSKISPYFKFVFEEKIYTKKISKNYCQLKKNSKVQLLTNDERSLFVFKDESITSELVALCIMFIVGIYCVLRY